MRVNLVLYPPFHVKVDIRFMLLLGFFFQKTQIKTNLFLLSHSNKSQWDLGCDSGLYGSHRALLSGLQWWRQPNCRVGCTCSTTEGGWAAGWHSQPFSVSHPKKSQPGRELGLLFRQQRQSYIFCRRQPWSTSQTYLSAVSRQCPKQGAMPASLLRIMFTVGLC